MMLLMQRLGVLLGNTLLVSGLTTALAGALGILLGLLLFRADFPGRRICRGALVVAALMPLHVTVAAWYALLWRLEAQPPDVVSAALLMAPAYVPLMAWVTALALAAIDPDREDAALLDAGWGRVLRLVTLPEARPILAAGLVLTFILASNEITATDVLRVRTFAEETFTQFSLRQPEQAWGAAAALGALALGLAVVLIRLMGSLTEISVDGLARRFQSRLRLPAGPITWLAAPLLLLVLFGLPLLSLIRALKSWDKFLEAVVITRSDLLYTFCWGGLGAALCAVLGLALGYVIARRRRRGGWLALLTLLALAPGPVVGYGLLLLLNRDPLPLWLCDSAFIVVLTHVARFLPLMALAAYPFAARLPAELRDAGRLDGAGPLRYFFSTVVPLSWPAAAALFLVSFALIVGEVGATALVSPAGTTMLSVSIFNNLHYGVYYDVAGAALALLLPLTVVGVTVFTMGERLMRD